MKNILDQSNKPNQKHFEKAYQYFLYSLILFVLAAGTSTLNALNYLEGVIPGMVIGFAIIALCITSITGLISGVRSYRSNEERNAKMWVGLIGNGLFALFFFSIILANVFDITRYL